MAINYKILFEVKVLHEYYLTEKDGSTIFDAPLQADRLAFLQRKAAFGAPSIHQNLAFSVPEPAKNTFRDQQLRLIGSYSGFKVFAGVKEETITGGIRAFRPAVELPDDLPILTSLDLLVPGLDSISNSPLKKPLTAAYYFTNRNLGEPRVFPVLSRPLPLRDDTLDYEQGELALDPADDQTKAFFFEKDGTRNWAAVNAAGFVNKNDPALVPVKFAYRFYKEDGAGPAVFTLKDSNGTTLSSQTHTVSGNSGAVTVDFAAVIPTVFDGAAPANPEVFSLEVSLNGGPLRVHPVVFCSPALKQAATWGLVHFQPRAGNPQFDLLDAAGLLQTRINADGSRFSHPIFEIRVKSRFVFGKYLNNKNEKLQDNPALHTFLDYDAARGIFETQRLLNATSTPVELARMDTSQFLPNPGKEINLEKEQQRVYLPIRVPRSGLFKV